VNGSPFLKIMYDTFKDDAEAYAEVLAELSERDG
jgi:hypothetical protein